MFTENREYHCTGVLTLRRSMVLDGHSQPKDDILNWLFLKVGERQLGFIYKIKNPLEAKYNIPFEADMSFLLIETARETIKLHHTYDVLRGQETIGSVRLINSLEEWIAPK